MTSKSFPEGFVWGAATAAFQIEGATAEGGRGPSIWDVFCEQPGAVLNGDSGEVACDHYHRYPADIALLKSLGITNYRFSTSWARVMPDGKAVNQDGLDFYDRLVDEILAAEITPWLTLYHWDLPAAIDGGWVNRKTADLFADFAIVMFERLGDRVKDWATLNEPWCSSFLSYAAGVHAPGHRNPGEAVAAAHHLLLAHGQAMAALRPLSTANHRLGITLNFSHVQPHDPAKAADIEAARLVDGAANRVFLDPLFRGEYADDVLEMMAPAGLASQIKPGDLELISAPIDYLGVNFYAGSEVAGADDRAAASSTPSPMVGAEQVRTIRRPGLPVTAMGWEVYAPDFTDLLVRLQRDYCGPAGVPLIVTENGAAYDDVLTGAGEIRDEEREEYLRSHISAVHDAIELGAEVIGYFVWSFLDNFEWAFGYSKRFGIVYVDYESLERTPKRSAYFFARLIAENRSF